LLADEPSTMLDPEVRAQVHAVLLEHTVGRGRGLVWVTHELDHLARRAHRVIVMDAGRVVEAGRVSDVVAAPTHEVTRNLFRGRAV
jgi:ABC-type glutathione transport system ATPase component